MAKAVNFVEVLAVRDKLDPELDEAIAMAPPIAETPIGWDAINEALDLKPIEVEVTV